MLRVYLGMFIVMSSPVLGMEQKHKRNIVTMRDIRHYADEMEELSILYDPTHDSYEMIVNQYAQECDRALQELFPDNFNKMRKIKETLRPGEFLREFKDFPARAKQLLGKLNGRRWEALEDIHFIHVQLATLWSTHDKNTQQCIKALPWLKEFLERFPLLEISRNITYEVSEQ